MDLEGVIGSVVEAAGLELVEVGFTSRSGRRVLRVTVDREGGVDLDTIAETATLARVTAILGLNAYHGDAAAAPVIDGELVAAAEEERFNRVKHVAGFPSLAAEWTARR